MCKSHRTVAMTQPLHNLKPSLIRILDTETWKILPRTTDWNPIPAGAELHDPLQTLHSHLTDVRHLNHYGISMSYLDCLFQHFANHTCLPVSNNVQFLSSVNQNLLMLLFLSIRVFCVYIPILSSP